MTNLLNNQRQLGHANLLTFLSMSLSKMQLQNLEQGFASKSRQNFSFKILTKARQWWGLDPKEMQQDLHKWSESLFENSKPNHCFHQIILWSKRSNLKIDTRYLPMGQNTLFSISTFSIPRDTTQIIRTRIATKGCWTSTYHNLKSTDRYSILLFRTSTPGLGCSTFAA